MKHLYLNTNCLLPVSNVTASCYSFIGAGCCNVISNGCSSIVGGFCNTISGGYSSILGDSGNSDGGFDYAGVFGCNVTAVASCALHSNNFVAQNMPTSPTTPGALWYNSTTKSVYIT